VTEAEANGGAVVVTGGARGIGRAVVERMLDDGAACVIVDKDGQQATATARELGERGSVEAIELDVRDWDAVVAAFERVAEAHGRLDGCVTAAGVQEAGPSESIESDRWKHVVDVNLSGVFACAQAAGRIMIESGSGGSIVNIASAAGVMALPGRAPYCSAKAGVISLTRVLGTEWAERGVRVNAVGPGWVETDLVKQAIADGYLDEEGIKRRTPLRRLATPAEIAEVVAFLLGPNSSYMTGQTVYPDGGFTSYGGWT
jgi:NAD(P)-dependent dehydrogenase (short-subunit alcohol dehydrogenase family)